MPIRCVVRVLVVDNDPVLRSQVVKILDGPGCNVRVAEGQGVELEDSAKTLARQFRPHVVIMDLRLSDEHADDRSGLNLWNDESFASARCILYSSHLNENYRITREALRQDGVEDVIGKEDSPQDLVDAVYRVARLDCGCRQGLSLVWPVAWNEDAIISYLYEEAEKPPRDIVLDVFGRLFPNTKELFLKPLEGTAQSSLAVGHGRSVLFQVWPDDKEPMVVKLAPRERILREKEAYQKFIEDRLVGQFSAQLHRHIAFWDLGAICYSFMGSSLRSMETFTTFYRQAESSSEIIKPLEHFFGETWRRHYTDSRRFLRDNLYNTYDPSQKLCQRLKLFPVQEKTLTFPGLPGMYINPAAWILSHQADSYFPSASQATIHGDLHGDNLFIDQDHAWAIDFERSGPSHILRDFVELEQNIVTRLMVLPENDLHLFYQVVLSLTKPVLPRETILIHREFKKDAEITKALEVINALRSLAQSVTQYQDMHEYYWGLLLDAAFSLMLAETYSPRWWRALLFSSLLCTRLKDWGRTWPPRGLPTSYDRQATEDVHASRRVMDNGSQAIENGGNGTSIRIGSITIEQGATVGDFFLAGEIQKSVRKADSANIQAELKETLKQLAEAVAKMSQSLPEGQAAEAIEDLSRLVDEATKTTPNRKWYSVSVDGLIKAAENVEKVGEPVINLSQKVLSLLTGG